MLAETVEAIVRTTPDTASPSVRSPMNSGRRVRAVLFDLDGTLYRQKRMRALMASELVRSVMKCPLRTPVSWWVLSEFRKAQEGLRGGEPSRGAAIEQFELTARRTGVPVDRVEAIVTEWMMERPLKHMRLCRADGLTQLLDFLSSRRVQVGVFSDYPPQRKLEALGVAGRFSVVLCSADPEIGRFKPHPRGFLVASSRWQLDPSEVLVVGDRLDVDAAGAAAAGMPCAIIGKPNPRESRNFVSFVSLERLRDALDDDHSR